MGKDVACIDIYIYIYIYLGRLAIDPYALPLAGNSRAHQLNITAIVLFSNVALDLVLDLET